LTFTDGTEKTAHINHTELSVWNGSTVVIATVGTFSENVAAVAAAFAPHGIYLGDELIYSG
jgi:hypothetical protein